MQFLDRTGVGTLWSMCKTKFALAGHTHNYAGSGSPGGSANSAIGVVDYNQTGKTIQIGYSGTGITGDQIKYIAGYTYGRGNVNAKIENVSKDALKSWLGLGSVVSNVAFSVNTNTGDNTLNVTKADGTVEHKEILKASKSNDGFMSREDKVKLDGIKLGANNYSLPIASSTTLGGIRVSANVNGSSWPICVDSNGLAQTKINGLTQSRSNFVSSLIVVNEDNHIAEYKQNGIDFGFAYGGFTHHIDFPSTSGTLALLSDISDTSNLCRFNFVNSISECKGDRINFFIRCSNGFIDLEPFDACPDGTILLITTTQNTTAIKHQSGKWYSCGDSMDEGQFYYTYNDQINLITKNEGTVHLYKF